MIKMPVFCGGLLALFLCTAASATPVFVRNVSETGGWYDVNKKTMWNDWPMAKPNWWEDEKPTRPAEWSTQPIDSQMCWAAAAANILQWWQDTRTDIPVSVPNGYASTYEAMPQVAQLSIYQALTKSWSNGGGQVEQAWNWWFNGGMLPDVYFSTASQLADNAAYTGAYWSNLGLVFDDANISSPLFQSYSFWSEGDMRHKDEFSAVFKDYIDNDRGTALTLQSETGGHAITMWGYDVDAVGDLVLYLTDSDDYALGMYRQSLKISESGQLYLDGIDSETARYAYDPENRTGWELTAIHGLTAPLGAGTIPEPSAPLLSMVALCLLAWKRRRLAV